MTATVVRQHVVRMPEDVIRPSVTLSPCPHRIVIQEDTRLCTLVIELVIHGIEHACDPQGDFVMVTDDQPMLAVQGRENLTSLFHIQCSPEYVADMPREVILSYDGVVASNQVFLHLFDIVVRPIAEFQDICVSIMFIGCVILHRVPIVILSTVHALQ